MVIQGGDVAQMVERSLCMREARGSIPRISSGHAFFLYLKHVKAPFGTREKFSFPAFFL